MNCTLLKVSGRVTAPVKTVKLFWYSRSTWVKTAIAAYLYNYLCNYPFLTNLNNCLTASLPHCFVDHKASCMLKVRTFSTFNYFVRILICCENLFGFWYVARHRSAFKLRESSRLVCDLIWLRYIFYGLSEIFIFTGAGVSFNSIFTLLRTNKE